MQLRNLDPFLLLDEFKVCKPAGFPDHPHRGFETVRLCTNKTLEGGLNWLTPPLRLWFVGDIHAGRIFSAWRFLWTQRYYQPRRLTGKGCHFLWLITNQNTVDGWNTCFPAFSGWQLGEVSCTLKCQLEMGIILVSSSGSTLEQKTK